MARRRPGPGPPVGRASRWGLRCPQTPAHQSTHPRGKLRHHVPPFARMSALDRRPRCGWSSRLFPDGPVSEVPAVTGRWVCSFGLTAVTATAPDGGGRRTRELWGRAVDLRAAELIKVRFLRPGLFRLCSGGASKISESVGKCRKLEEQARGGFGDLPQVGKRVRAEPGLQADSSAATGVWRGRVCSSGVFQSACSATCVGFLSSSLGLRRPQTMPVWPFGGFLAGGSWLWALGVHGCAVDVPVVDAVASVEVVVPVGGDFDGVVVGGDSPDRPVWVSFEA